MFHIHLLVENRNRRNRGITEVISALQSLRLSDKRQNLKVLNLLFGKKAVVEALSKQCLPAVRTGAHLFQVI